MAVIIGSDKVIGLTFWCCVLLAFTVIEVIGHVPASRMPSLGALVTRYFSHPIGRAFALVVWLYAGYHLFSH